MCEHTEAKWQHPYKKYAPGNTLISIEIILGLQIISEQRAMNEYFIFPSEKFILSLVTKPTYVFLRLSFHTHSDKCFNMWNELLGIWPAAGRSIREWSCSVFYVCVCVCVFVQREPAVLDAVSYLIYWFWKAKSSLKATPLFMGIQYQIPAVSMNQGQIVRYHRSKINVSAFKFSS